jgi:transforming growth factor-beta-induced protein
LQGEDITLSISGGVVKANAATVVVANALTQNGVVHVIDQVLIPASSPQTSIAAKSIVETAQSVPSLSTLVKVLTTPGYEDVLKALSSPGNYTVFAPNDDAFQAAGVDPSQVEVVKQVLYYHVLDAVVKSTDLAALQFPTSLMSNGKFVNLGGKGQVTGITKNADGVFINFGIPGVADVTAQVIMADVECSNGVVHIIDRVLMFPKTVAETAVTAGLTELAAALTKADLVSAVDDTKTLTIFAPTNEAMKAAKWETLDLATLTAVLTYHVVPAVAYSTDLTDGEKVPTLQGEDITLSISGGVVKANGATVVVANALTQNGVVHVIDQVLIPAL